MSNTLSLSKPRKPSESERREASYGQRLRDATAAIAYWHGAAVGALEHATDLQVLGAFLGGLRALTAVDVATVTALEKFSPEACWLIVKDLRAGPHVVAALHADPQLASRLASLPATEQAVEVGKLLERLGVPKPEPAPVTSVFSLYGARSVPA